MNELMGLREYARHRAEKGLPGTTHQAVTKAIRSGRISVIQSGDDNRPKIDPAVADIQWDRNTDPDQSARANAGRDVASGGANAPDGKGEGSRFWLAKTSREEVELARARLALEKEAGQLVDRAAVERAAYATGRLLRDMVLSVPTRLAAELAVVNDAQTIEARIRVELSKVLAELSRLTKTGLVDSPEKAR